MLGERISQRRKHLGLTQEELASRINVSQRQVSFYETGRNSPTAGILVNLADELNTTTDWLLGRTENPERPLRNSHDLTDTEREIIHMLRTKPPEWERKFLDFIRIG